MRCWHSYHYTAIAVTKSGKSKCNTLQIVFLFINFQLCYCFIHSQKYLFTFIHPPKILFSQSQMVSACFLPSVPSKDHFHNTSSSLVSKYVDPIFYNMDIICLLLYLQFDDCYITRNHIHADCKKLHLHLFLLDYESNIERTHHSKAVHCIQHVAPEASLPNCDCLIYLLCFNESTKCFLLLIDTISSADLQFILPHQHQPSKKAEIGQCKLWVGLRP